MPRDRGRDQVNDTANVISAVMMTAQNSHSGGAGMIVRLVVRFNPTFLAAAIAALAELRPVCRARRKLSNNPNPAVRARLLDRVKFSLLGRARKHRC
jgi:hypothetical protein